MIENSNSKEQDDLERVKKMTEIAYDCQKENNERWNRERRFVYHSTITEEDDAYLSNMGQPKAEANIIEAHLKNVQGNVLRSKPSLQVRPIDDISVPLQVKIIEGHVQHDLLHSGYNDTIPEAVDDMLSGGFTAIKCYADYKNQRSYERSIFIKKAYDPTKVLFDPMAQLRHAGDGRMVVEIVPMTQENFKNEYPDVDIDNVKYNPPVKDAVGFNWFGMDACKDKSKIVIFADFYEKRSRRVRMLKVPDLDNPGRFKGMTSKEYSDMVKDMEEKRDTMGDVSVIPKPVEKASEMRVIDEIWHSQFIGNQFIKKPEKTDLSELPWARGDGNGKMIDGRKLSRSWHFQARDIQRAKNMALNELFNQMNTSIRAKILIDEEALPTAQVYRDAYKEPYRNRGAMVYRSYAPKGGPGGQGRNLPAPIPIPGGDMSPVTFQMYQSFDGTLAATLGNYQQQMGIDRRISGNAIREGKREGHASSKSILDGVDAMLNQIGRVYLSLIPTVYDTERTIATIDEDGKPITVVVNQRDEDGKVLPHTSMNFDPNDLDVKIIAGMDLESEKDEAFNTMLEMASRIPAAQQFFGQNLPIMIDNLNIRGKDSLKEAATKYLQNQKEMAKQQAQKPNAEQQLVQVEQQKAQNEAKAVDNKAQYEAKNAQLKEQQLRQQFMRIQADIANNEAKLALEMEKADSREEKETIELQLKQQEDQRKSIELAMKNMGI